MDRSEMLGRVEGRREFWDIIVVGGGATGVGLAVDAGSRGLDVLLLEGDDFGKGTSSRSTKLVHGGVRYLAQGNVGLVMGALRERGRLRRNAPQLVRDRSFVVPGYRWWERPYYGIGLCVYDALAGRESFGRSRVLSRGEALELVPTLRPDGLRGGVVYHDGQFDDARLLIALARTAAGQGATLLNYAPVSGLTRDHSGRVDGVEAVDRETGRPIRAGAKVVINATGAFSDEVRRMAVPEARPLVAPSRGIHLVFDRSFLPGDGALMVPRTSDGRVVFAIPWESRALVGTTDTPIDQVSAEPRASEAEIEFLLETIGRYLVRPPSRHDILSVFAGIRPLVRSSPGRKTSSLARDHTIRVDAPGLLTIAGGKWTTYRRMAEDGIDRALALAGLPHRPCATRDLRLHGFDEDSGRSGELAFYGSDAPAIRALARDDPTLGEPLDPALATTGAEVVWSAREEMARTVEDVLSRRSRALFLDARAAARMAPRVASLLAPELGRDGAWRADQVRAFNELARGYLPP